MADDNHTKEPASEKDNVSPLEYIAKASENVFSVMKLLLGVSVMIGVIYNFGYFYNFGIAYTIFLDYTDFLYTPLFIIGKIISLSLIIVTIRLTWMSRPQAAAIDMGFTVVIFILFVFLSISDERSLLTGVYAAQIGIILSYLALTVSLLWAWKGIVDVRTKPGLTFGALSGFLVLVFFQGQQQADYDMNETGFPDQLTLKDKTVLADLRFLRFVGKGVFYVTRSNPRTVSFYKSEAFDSIQPAVNSASR